MPTFALILLVASAEPAGSACPTGDDPTGELSSLEHTRRLRTVEVTDGHAVVTFEDVVENLGPSAATIDLPLGVGGVIRSASLEEAGLPRRFTRLDDSDAAAVRFDEYKHALQYGVDSAEAHRGKARAALLVHHTLDASPTISILAACSVRRVVVRVAMLLPSLPIDGGWRFSVPGEPGEGVVNELVVDSDGPIRVLVEDVPVAPGTRHGAPGIGGQDEDGALTLTVTPLVGARLRARGFVRTVAPTAAPVASPASVATDVAVEPVEPVEPVVVARAELDLPRPLTDAPANLRLVFVIDASVSVGTKGIAKALQLMNAVLDEAPPDTRFALVAAARRPRVVVPTWRARDDRELPVLEAENGSDVLAALKKANGMASDVAEDEVARVIVVSDMQLRFAEDDARVARAFIPVGRARVVPLAHVVVLPDDADIELPLSWARSFVDQDPRAAGPESTGGIWIDAGGEDESTLFAHLIHPTRLDRPRVTLGGKSILSAGLDDCTYAPSILASPRDPRDIDVDDEGLPLFLVAGSGLRVSAALPIARASHDLSVGGLLWATPLQQRVSKDDSLFGLTAVDGVGAGLADDLVRTIARDAYVVSRVTSLVAVPNFRPATLAPMGWGTMCSGTCGGCSSQTSCSIRCAASQAKPDLQERETLERLLREDASTCREETAELAIELGDLEILGVHANDGGPCVVERFWQRRLDLLPRVPGAFVVHQEITVRVDRNDG